MENNSTAVRHILSYIALTLGMVHLLGKCHPFTAVSEAILRLVSRHLTLLVGRAPNLTYL